MLLHSSITDLTRALPRETVSQVRSWFDRSSKLTAGFLDDLQLPSTIEKSLSERHRISLAYRRSSLSFRQKDERIGSEQTFVEECYREL